MGKVRQFFRSVTEPIFASFSTTDIFQGIAYIDAYGTKNNTGANFIVITVADYNSDPIQTVTSAVAVDTTFGKEVDIDFDLEITKSTTFDGQFFANIPTAITPASQTAEWYSIVRIRKWDGSTETEIVNAQGVGSSTSTGTNKSHLDAVQVDFPRTRFQKGQTLRLTIEIWAKTTASTSNIEIYLGHDPIERTSTVFPTDDHTSTQLRFRLPIKTSI